MRPVLLHRAGELMAMPTIPCFSLVCTVATTFMSRGVAKLHGTFSGMVPSAIAVLSRSTFLNAVRVCPLLDTQHHTWSERLSLQMLTTCASVW